MKFEPCPVADAFVIELEKRGDARGFFARAFCEREFANAGIETRFVQANNSLSVEAGTLRGMHFQTEPASEVKVVRCISGALWDVVLDLRPNSPSYLKWFGTEITAENRKALVVPRGCAHGFITLAPNTEAFYLVSAFYSPENDRGVRWDDPAFGIKWPRTPSVLSERDMKHSDYDPKNPFFA